MHFPAQHRLRTTGDFRRMKENAKKINCGGFTFLYLIKEEGPARIGIITSIKVGGAVKRNYAKRIFREIFRLNYEKVRVNCDILIVVRSHFDNYSFLQLEEQFLKACKNISNGK